MTVFFNVLVSFFSGSILMYVSQSKCYFIDQFTWLTELDEQWGDSILYSLMNASILGILSKSSKLERPWNGPFIWLVDNFSLILHLFGFAVIKLFFSVRMALWWWIGSFGLKHIFYF